MRNRPSGLFFLSFTCRIYGIIYLAGVNMYARVLMDLKTTQIEPFYDYIIPSDLKGFLKVGMRVIVPFGNLTRAAIIVEILSESKLANKPISYALDVTPSVTKSQIHLIEYLEKTALMPKQLAFSLVVPLALQMKYQKRIKVLDRSNLGHLAKVIVKDDVILDIDLYQHMKAIKKAVEQGYLLIEDVIQSKGKIQYEPYYSIKPSHARLTENRKNILDFIGQNEVPLSILLQQGFTKNSLNSMHKSGMLSIKMKERLKKSDLFFQSPYQDKTLTKAQQHAIHTIQSSIHTYERFLLHGVTASGKTEVFLSLRKNMDQSKQLLILVPEIAQVYQIASSFSSIFDDIYMMHSNLSLQERYDTWRQISNGNAKIIIGTKHSIFLPFKSLGMIIIDEAHDNNYIQENTPRFSAIDLSVELARKEQLPLVLSTATPTIEQYYDAQMGKMTYIALEEKVFQTNHQTLLVDMKQELLNGNKDIISSALNQAILALKPKEQAMILLNRRGYAPFMMCRECGYVPTCPVCHTSMVFHKKKNSLMCHHCGTSTPMIQTCPSCHSDKIKSVGIGIEQVEDILIKKYPTKTIARLDSDSVQKKDAESILLKFKQKEIDILIGTQMIAKGHDFDVKVSAVLLADMGLKVSSYLANEQTYNLIKQMQGRSGRFKDGISIIQTYDMNHFVLKSLDKPFEHFYETEIHNRKLSYYPPFSKLVYVTFMHKDETLLEKTLTKLKHELMKRHSQYTILGPSESFVPYKNGLFHYHLLLKVPKRTDLSYQLKSIIEQYQKTVKIDINLFDSFI